MNDSQLYVEYGIPVETLIKYIGDALNNNGLSPSLAILAKHGHDREDVTQHMAMRLHAVRSDYDADKAEVTTFVTLVVKREVWRMVRDAQKDKRKAQYESVSVNPSPESSVDLLNAFGTTPGPAELPDIDYITSPLITQFGAHLTEAFVEYTTSDYSVRELVAKYGYNQNKLQRTFAKMRQYLRGALADVA
ncbi:sigma factor [Exiguobacterium sp. CinTr1]|uniref:sigma factor n=1 Tax=Exiguobacterium sp. CinTr1 TaxID=2995315 RepID=UPI0022E71650|nr:sigma factor [Exiguobacterium sp. CinTr1]